ncbi:MAG: biotin/lipoyl-binding protein [Acidimicrobiia bacterium]|nr:biotin/lipoyl-binding protein [Acidimicrobiia bacterium]
MTTTVGRGPSDELLAADAPEWQRPPQGRRAWARRRLLRPVVLIPALLVIAALVYWIVHSSSSSPAQGGAVQRVVAVTAGNISQAVSTTGTLAPADTESLSFSTSGQVTAVNVKAGQQVAKGTVLATLDSAALQSQVTSAQASVDSATAKLSNDETTSGSAAQIQSDQANLAAAQAQLASAQASLNGATLTAPIDGTVAAVNLTVGQQLSGTGTGGTNLSGSATGSGRSNAPTSGSSSSGFGGGGNNSASSSSSSSSSSSTPQIQMISTGAFIVNVNVDDTQIGRIAVGQAATVTPSSTPGAGGRGGGGAFARFFGGGAAQNNTPTTVDNSQAQAGQAALGQQSQTTTATGTVTSVGAIASNTSGVAQFPVVVTLTNTPQGFFAGSTVNVSITYNQLTNVLEVPTLAITRTNGAEYVTVSEAGKKSQRAVTTGVTSGGFTQITGGVARGELVVVTIPTQIANAANNASRTGGSGTGGFGGGGGFRTGGGGGGGGGGFRGGGGG